jgi:hypothetical protein
MSSAPVVIGSRQSDAAFSRILCECFSSDKWELDRAAAFTLSAAVYIRDVIKNVDTLP